MCVQHGMGEMGMGPNDMGAGVQQPMVMYPHHTPYTKQKNITQLCFVLQNWAYAHIF